MKSVPICVNKVGGWALDIVKILWPNVLEDNSQFTDLNDRVFKEVSFPCVIFAKYDFGIVAIDCNDCDTYEVDDPRIAIYIKLQFNPTHQYKQKVYPFTFIPQKPTFTAELANHKIKYSNTHKTYPAWGRFIQVSLDRYHLSHAIGRLGLPGGGYVLSETGYEDHYLDPIKPRQRMPFDEYISCMYKSMAVIDARGFGDLTHRTIESLAIGVPLIRPKFTVQTADPLVAGVHYLDCGVKGERLQECVNLVQNHYVRRSLIEAGWKWYESNCTQKGMQELLQSIIGKHHTAPKKAPIVTIPAPKQIDNPKFHMLIGLYKDKSPIRMLEIIETFRFNLADDMIEKIHVFWEDPTSLEEAIKIIPELTNEKVDLIWHGKRLFFYDLFRYANSNLQRVIIANNDIYFGNLSILKEYDLTGRILCVSRWDIFKYQLPRYMDCDASQDAWIFQTPINLDPQFHLGWWGCDGRINREATAAGLLVSNPSYELLAYHNHPSGVRNYDSTRDNVPNGCGIPPSKLVWPKQVTPTRFRQAASIEFSEKVGYNVFTLIDGISSHANRNRRFIDIPPELYGLQFNMVMAWESAPMRIRCTSQGFLYILVGRDWHGGIIGTLEELNAAPTAMVVESTETKYDVWSLPMRVNQEITLPVQAIIVGQTLKRV